MWFVKMLATRSTVASPCQNFGAQWKKACSPTSNCSHVAVRIVVSEISAEFRRELIYRSQTLKLLRAHLTKPCSILDRASHNCNLCVGETDKVYRLRGLGCARFKLRYSLRKLNGFDWCVNGRRSGGYCKDGYDAASDRDPLKQGFEQHICFQ